jgi:hypothetical protein
MKGKLSRGTPTVARVFLRKIRAKKGAFFAIKGLDAGGGYPPPG